MGKSNCLQQYRNSGTRSEHLWKPFVRLPIAYCLLVSTFAAICQPFTGERLFSLLLLLLLPSRFFITPSFSVALLFTNPTKKYNHNNTLYPSSSVAGTKMKTWPETSREYLFNNIPVLMKS